MTFSPGNNKASSILFSLTDKYSILEIQRTHCFYIVNVKPFVQVFELAFVSADGCNAVSDPSRIEFNLSLSVHIHVIDLYN